METTNQIREDFSYVAGIAYRNGGEALKIFTDGPKPHGQDLAKTWAWQVIHIASQAWGNNPSKSPQEMLRHIADDFRECQIPRARVLSHQWGALGTVEQFKKDNVALEIPEIPQELMRYDLSGYGQGPLF